MTTIAVKDGVMACDSQLTNGVSGSVQKIRKKGDIIIGYCGDWIAAEYMAKYYLSDRQEELIEDRKDDVELIVLKKTGIYIVDKKLREARICGKHYSIGSGSMAAMTAMNMGATAIEAIREAIKVDEYSGGKIKSIAL